MQVVGEQAARQEAKDGAREILVAGPGREQRAGIEAEGESARHLGADCQAEGRVALVLDQVRR